MRQAYTAHGVVGYYKAEGTSYRNPHFDALCAALAAALTQLFAEDKAQLVNAAAPEQPGVEASEANVLQTGSGALRLRVLDLACGSGEASIAVHRWMLASAPAFGRLALTAADPFTAGAFHARTQLPRVQPWSFEDVQAGCLAGRAYDLVVCSFAMHLLDESRLYATLLELAAAARWLVLLSPHKRPVIKDGCGWSLAHSSVHERVHVRIYEACAVVG